MATKKHASHGGEHAAKETSGGAEPQATEAAGSNDSKHSKDASAPRIDETVPGGHYIKADGTHVNANGEPLDEA